MGSSAVPPALELSPALRHRSALRSHRGRASSGVLEPGDSGTPARGDEPEPDVSQSRSIRLGGKCDGPPALAASASGADGAPGAGDLGLCSPVPSPALRAALACPCVLDGRL